MQSTPVTYIDFQPDEEDVPGYQIVPNVVSVSIGVPGVRKPSEMGDGLFNYNVPVFIDIYGENRGVAWSIGLDVMDILRKYRDTSYINDYTNPSSPVPSGDTWEVDNEQGPLLTPAAAQAQDFRKFWRVCRFEAHVEYLQ